MLKKVKKFQKQLKIQKGFSLIELIIIMLILGISLVPLTTLVKNNQKDMADVNLYIQAEYFTQSVMEELIADYSSQGYTYVINNWTNATRNHPELSMTAGIGIDEDVDLQTDIKYADVVVGVSMANGIRTSLVCRIVDNN